MKYVVTSIWLVVTAVLCIISYKNGASTAVVLTDTIEVVKWDIIVKTQPVVVENKALGLKAYRVKLLGRIEQQDSLCDSVDVELPITQKVYEDSLYRAWVSGFDAKLDSIELHQPTRYITITTEKEQSKWSFGLQGGVGITPKGVQPYIGVGFQWNFNLGTK